jgi:predicted ATP-grasp superfamily ATP-dependent carboligase
MASQPAVLLTLGRLPKALDLARGFAALGHRVIVAEPFKSHVTGASRHVARSYQVTAPSTDREQYLRDLATIVEREAIGLVVPVSEEILHASRLAPRLPAQVRMLAMPHEALLELHDKLRFTAVCARLGVDAPRTAPSDAPLARQIAADARYVIKPVYSCSGRGVRVLDRGAPIPSDAGRSIVQEYVAGSVMSSFTYAHRGRPVITVVYRGAVMSGTVAVCFERLSDQSAIERWVAQFVERIDFSGFISFDFVVDCAGRPWGIECNPRATSGLHFVQSESLARAILEPDSAPPPQLRRELLLQQLYPCLTETQRSLLHDRSRFTANLTALWRARDVTWERSDPWPFISMPATSFGIIRESMRRGCTFGEVATLDVGWYDGP